MPTPAFRPIAATLIRSIFVWASVCALLIGLGQSAFSYLHVQDEFEQELREIADANVPLLSVGLWDIEPDALQRQISAIAERPSIGFVRLAAATGQEFVAGDQRLRHEQSVRRFDIPPPGRPTGALGRLEIHGNPAAFYRELVTTVGLALGGYGVLTLLICALIAYILKRDLERPLRHIAGFVTRLTPEKLTLPLTLDRPAEHQRDEIDLVADGFRVLQEGINDHIRNLDLLVAQRTQELERAMAEIHALSLRDPLTGCFNRRSFDERIAREIERAERYGRPLSVVFADIDHFKAINDSHGHLVGDRVLQAVAESFRSGVRVDVDWVARYGGEEFVIVMPETTEGSAVASAERLRAGILVGVALPDHPLLRVSASFGVAQYRPGDTVDQLVGRSDGALYAAKAAGRNRTVAADDVSDD